MTRLPFTLMLAWVSLVLPGASQLSAQSSQSTSPPPELTLFLGGSSSSRLDATASPRIFEGFGPSARLEYGQGLAGGRYLLNASAGAGRRTASPSGADDAASEHTVDADARATVMRQWSRSPRSAIGLGLTATANLDLTEHRYADPSTRNSDFRMSSVTLGPTLGWASPLRGGQMRLQLTSPAVGFVNHPYSDVRGGASLGRTALVSVTTLRGANAQASYATSFGRKLGVTYSYRFGFLDYADVQPFRSMSHQLSIGLSHRFSNGAGR